MKSFYTIIFTLGCLFSFVSYSMVAEERLRERNEQREASRRRMRAFSGRLEAPFEPGDLQRAVRAQDRATAREALEQTIAHEIQKSHQDHLQTALERLNRMPGAPNPERFRSWVAIAKGIEEGHYRIAAETAPCIPEIQIGSAFCRLISSLNPISLLKALNDAILAKDPDYYVRLYSEKHQKSAAILEKLHRHEPSNFAKAFMLYHKKNAHVLRLKVLIEQKKNTELAAYIEQHGNEPVVFGNIDSFIRIADRESWAQYIYHSNICDPILGWLGIVLDPPSVLSSITEKGVATAVEGASAVAELKASVKNHLKWRAEKALLGQADQICQLLRRHKNSIPQGDVEILQATWQQEEGERLRRALHATVRQTGLYRERENEIDALQQRVRELEQQQH